MFAKNEKIKLELQNNWQEVKRKYYCVVEGKIDKSMSLRNYLYETNTHEVKITNDSKKGKYAQTDLEVIKSNNKYTLLDINIITGRKNQIRAQLAYINHSIIGDKKYGSYVKTPLMLQAYLLEFIHPITHKLISIEEKINKNFQKIIN